MPSFLIRLLFRGRRALPEPEDAPFTPDEVGRLQQAVPGDAADVLDDATWRDLLLARYADTLAPGTSIFGRQVLYRRLRAGSDTAAVAAQRARIERLLGDPGQLEALRGKLACLRRADIDVATLLFHDEQPVRPDWVGYLMWLPVLLAASIACALLVSPWSWIGTGIAMYLLVSVHMRYMHRIALWTRSVAALQMLLRACALLDYRTLALVFVQRDFLRECYWLCAELEADVALARHLRARSDAGLAWCRATRTAPRTLALQGGVHPLLDQASGLSIALDGKGAFLSGQNGAGKSTFLRMLGLNLVTARAFGFCYAQAASLPALPVVASMQNEDSLLGGQSLYVAELARARALLAAARGPRPVLCLVDEIFRGTNHEESVSAAVADQLARDALVVVSSHNLVLGSLPGHVLEPWRIVRAQAEGGLRLEPGVLGRTNGVALLAEHGFDAAIQDKAAQVAAWLAQQRINSGSEHNF